MKKQCLRDIRVKTQYMYIAGKHISYCATILFCFVYPMLPISQDFPFFNAPLIFFKVYCTRQNLVILSVSKDHTYKCDICHRYKFYGRHHDLVDRYGISVSQMTKYMFHFKVISSFMTYHRLCN